jgi:putative hemolysin
MEYFEKTIDIEKAIREGDNKVLRSLPRFMITLLRKLVYEDEINLAIYRSRHLSGVPFVIDILEGWNVKVNIEGGENLPASGRFIFASNHPVGGIDALSIFLSIYRYYNDIVSPANQLLNTVPNLRSMVFGLDVFGKASRETAAKLDELYESDRQIMIFPAGEVSRRNGGVISDITWQKSFITKAVKHRRDIIPLHVTGKNSNLFYTVASLRKKLGIKMYVETLLLPREMMKQRNGTVTVTFGRPIPYQSFTSEKSPQEWAQAVKEIVYSLARAHPNPSLLHKEGLKT